MDRDAGANANKRTTDSRSGVNKGIEYFYSITIDQRVAAEIAGWP